MRPDVDVPADAHEGVETGDGGFGTGQDDEVGERQRGRRVNGDEIHLRLERQGVQVVEITDAGQHRHNNGDPRTGSAPRGLGERHRILGRQLGGVGEMRHEPEHGPPGALRHESHAVREQARIAAEPVDQDACDERRIGRIDDRLGADDLGDDAAPVDVTEQHHRDVRGPCEAHIGDIVAAKVHLGGAARPLDQDQVGLVAQVRKAVHDGAHQARLPILVLAGLRVAEHAALHHYLGAHLALRLQQHGVHVHARRHAGGARLERLRAADLATVPRDGRIVGHVLRLERTHGQAAISEGPRKAGDDQALADIRPRALDHQRAGRRRPAQNSIPACALTPAAK